MILYVSLDTQEPGEVRTCAFAFLSLADSSTKAPNSPYESNSYKNSRIQKHRLLKYEIPMPGRSARERRGSEGLNHPAQTNADPFLEIS